MPKKNIEQHEIAPGDDFLQETVPAPEFAYTCLVEVVTVINGRRQMWFRQIRSFDDWRLLAEEIDAAAL